ncbi:SET domain-containing protein [Auriscalpium vulgare]|uniref:SET domain-containing protein n=1 Tax=Auriscalpium vulgare TaxID=40419 RepID=A0ACB8RJF5_9AGAM|nr:SET domain-containing protein [Auriscalpium vulgare]
MHRGFLTSKNGDRRAKVPDLFAISPSTTACPPPPIVPIPAPLTLNPLLDWHDHPDAVNQAYQNNTLSIRYERIDIPDVEGGSHIITAGVYTTRDQTTLSSHSWKPLDRSAAGRYEIRETEGAGKSMFSLDRHEPGGLIACERPLMITSLTWLGSDEKDAPSTMEGTFAHMPEETRHIFLSLHRGPPTARSPALAITMTNAYILKRVPGSIDECAGVFNDISRINHSCVPNAVFRWDGDSLTFEIRALRPIAPGEEVTLSYVHACALYDERRSDLQQRYGFTCTCSSCSLAPAERFVDDQVRSAAEHMTSAKVRVTSASALRDTKEALGIARRIRAAGLFHPFVWDRIAATLVAAACAWGERARAVRWARVAAQAARMQIGTDGGWEAVAAAPEQTEWWRSVKLPEPRPLPHERDSVRWSI